MFSALRTVLNRRLDGLDLLNVADIRNRILSKSPAEPAPLKTADELVDAELKAFYEKWRELAGCRFAPMRADIAPRNFRRHLPRLFIIDVIDHGADFFFRLGGEAVVRFMGRRYAGSMLSELRGAPFFESMRCFLSYCAARKAPVAAGPTRSTREGREDLETEVVVLPLSEDGLAVSALFGAIALKPLHDGIFSETTLSAPTAVYL